MPCTDRILQAGIPVVVIAWREPSTFVEDCIGVEKLKENDYGTFLLSGDVLTDQEALEQMKIPDHETAVIVPVAVQRRPDAVPA